VDNIANEVTPAKEKAEGSVRDVQLHQGTAANPFDVLTRPAQPAVDRLSAPTESYSIRLPVDLKRRVSEAVVRSGGRAADLFESLLDVYEEAQASEPGMPEKFARVRRDVESHLRSLMVGLTASLRDLAADDETHEAQAADLASALLASREREASSAVELTARAVEAARTAADRETERAQGSAKLATVVAELEDTKTTLRGLNETVAELREKLQEFAGQKERLQRAERERDEARTTSAHEARTREEAELKLARKVEDAERLRRQLTENEAMRARQQQMEEEERAVLKARSAAERERLEATIDRLKERMGEMTRENGK